MPTPDEVYDQVLAEETAKGSSPAVAQARAKAARVRAQRGSATPNKPDPATASRGGTEAAPAAGPAAAPTATPGADAPAEAQPAGVVAATSAAARPAAPAAARPAAVATATRPPAAKKAVGNGQPEVPERVQRLLAVVKPESIQKVERQPMDRVNVWPHLMAAELISLLVVLLFLTIFSATVDAPLRELANFNQTPNPSKAPWYFLGLQELLRYFHPQVAGVTIPTVIIIGLMAAPFVDRNPSTRPDDRKLAIVLFSFFVLSFSILVILGMFFRGPGFNFVFPWKGGIFFEL
ncbi:MAG: menaquinol-cytochrome c reductase cytochrome b/c subunit [Actinomycetota bacterium]|jgi:menaquinol-cytochrome c reductase cytochrome b/c subunit|nr:menaquinol-cytochrome c reductase cytochrome b/c subunit [Actinomycetota bacterium]